MYGIYWIENHKRCGPTTVPDILGRVQRGELTPDTLGWHSGCADWMPLRQLPALADFLAREEPPPAAEAEAPAPAAEQPAQPATPQPGIDRQLLNIALPSPTNRLLARLIDTALYATLALGIMHMLQLPYKWYLQPGSPAFWLPFPVLEALLLYRWHTTPGKRWMGIYLHPLSGRFRLGSLLGRSVLVGVMGMGCMLFPVTLVTLLLSYFYLRQRGITLWDVQAGSLPVHKRRPSVASAIAAACFLFFAMQLCSQYMQPWMPDMMQELREQSPQAAQMLEDWITPLRH